MLPDYCNQFNGKAMIKAQAKKISEQSKTTAKGITENKLDDQEFDLDGETDKHHRTKFKRQKNILKANQLILPYEF